MCGQARGQANKKSTREPHHASRPSTTHPPPLRSLFSPSLNTARMSSQKAVTTPYPLIDSDPHAFRVVRYFRPSDYATVAAGTAAFPAALYFWGASKRPHSRSNLLTLGIFVHRYGRPVAPPLEDTPPPGWTFGLPRWFHVGLPTFKLCVASNSNFM